MRRTAAFGREPTSRNFQPDPQEPQESHKQPNRSGIAERGNPQPPSAIPSVPQNNSINRSTIRPSVFCRCPVPDSPLGYFCACGGCILPEGDSQ